MTLDLEALEARRCEGAVGSAAPASESGSQVLSAYDVVLMDPPWLYYGDPNKDQAAGKHYACLSDAEIAQFPVPDWLTHRGILYVWVTSSMLSRALHIAEDAWKLTYRGTAFVWVKTRKDGTPIHGQGVRPSITKPTSESVLAFSRVVRGRPLPILRENVPQVILAPRTRHHSEKPAEVRRNIEQLHGPVRRLEVFARHRVPGWDAFGNEVGKLIVP